MTFRQAKQLHNEYEVYIKEAGVVAKVLHTSIVDKTVLVTCVYDDKLLILTHKEVK